MVRNIFIFLFIGVVMLFLCSVSSGDVPHMINYQGKLTTPDGGCLNDTVQMTFSIYPDTLGSPADWSENQTDVVVREGIFNVLLGSLDTIPEAVFDGNVKYLGVQVETDLEMRPLKPIVSVAYAYKSLKADTADYVHVVNDHWYLSVTDVADTSLITGGPWGIARAGNSLYGNRDSTHVNLGLASATGLMGEDREHCTVSGGRYNTASGSSSVVGGGAHNRAEGEGSTVGGGMGNQVTAANATVGGGFQNHVRGAYSTIGGGWVNVADGVFATVGGGDTCTASGSHASICGGRLNTASGEYSTVAGGRSNTASLGLATVGGGGDNVASGLNATVAGGYTNTANGYGVTVVGGHYNTASGDRATVGGGELNSADGNYATVPGGANNSAAGDYGFAAGFRAKANHNGAFVWSDGVGGDFVSTGDNQFLIDASGGVGIGTTAPQQQLDVAGTAQVTGFKMPTGAVEGHVLTSDGSGVGTWQAKCDTVAFAHRADTANVALNSIFGQVYQDANLDSTYTNFYTDLKTILIPGGTFSSGFVVSAIGYFCAPSASTVDGGGFLNIVAASTQKIENGGFTRVHGIAGLSVRFTIPISVMFYVDDSDPDWEPEEDVTIRIQGKKYEQAWVYCSNLVIFGQ